MHFTISGFGGEPEKKDTARMEGEGEMSQPAPRRSVAQIRFPERGVTLAYYNDQFDLKVGDLVYVDGKLEGYLGHVVGVSYNFKIKLSDYKRVIALVNTHVHGKFYLSDSYVLTFDPAALPAEQAASWFKAPSAGEEYVGGSDDSSFPLEHLEQMKVDEVIAERGYNYYIENRVRYICLNGTKGYAIVEGTNAYTVEFAYQDGEIRSLVCDCFCPDHCKHEFAAMLQLKDFLAYIQERNFGEFEKTGYVAAVTKAAFYAFAIAKHSEGCITL